MTGASTTPAPLLEHLIEVRRRLIRAGCALILGFALCYSFAGEIFAFLLEPFERAAGNRERPLTLIYTAPHEYFFAQIKLALFAGFALAFPYIAAQIYAFVAPGLYRHEKRAFAPFLVAAPVMFMLGAALAHYVVMPLALRFFLGMEHLPQDPNQAAIAMLPRVSEYLSLTTNLIFAFGLCFQLPVALTLLARAGLVRAQTLRRGRKYAFVLAFALAAILTPPDVISQIGLAVPTIILYEISILAAQAAQRRHDTSVEDTSVHTNNAANDTSADDTNDTDHA